MWFVTIFIQLPAAIYYFSTCMEHNRRGSHRSEQDSWRSLQLFLLYRLGISAVILALFHYDLIPGIPASSAQLFLTAAFTLLAINLLALPVTYLRLLHFRHQVIGMMTIDIIALTVLMHASSGLDSGLGLLMLPSIAGASLLLPGNLAPAFAALGTLVVFIEIGLGWLHGRYDASTLTFGGIQGALFFGVAILAAKLARRARASEALARQRGENLENLTQLNAFIVEQMEDGILVVNARGKILACNEAARRILGKPELKPGRMLASASLELKRVHDTWRQQGTNPNETLPAPSADGSEFETRLVKAGEGALIFLHNIRERSRRMQELKLAALGRLTASIAHEIRNPLGAISHATQLLSESDALNSADRRLAQIISNNSERMNTLVENILNLSRRENTRAQKLPLQPWLSEVIEEFRARYHLDKDQLKLALPDEALAASADPSQLHQVIWNLLRNAQTHAAPHDSLQIEIRGGQSPENRIAWLDIRDNGRGVDQDIEDQLFEPFFTTGHANTGLGLYLARELCEGNGGSLELVRGDQPGCCFRVKLPLAA